MKCLLIDDDPFQRHLLTQYIDQVEKLDLVAEFDSAMEAVRYLQKEKVDLIFLDVEMPGMNGLEFLAEFKPQADIVFISSQEKYAFEGFELNVSDYLLKPISFSRFNRSVSKIMAKKFPEQTGEENQFLFIKDKGVYQKVLIQDILYIQSSSEYVTIYTKAKRTMLYSSMDGMLKRLPANFVRVHRSFIVNLHAIEKVNGNMVEINNKSISVSKTYQQELMGHLGLKVKQRNTQPSEARNITVA
jgi:DNA-binding LytR/AlgR family response regulator